MPGLIGIVADRWVNAERMYGICHLVGAGLLLWASTVKEFDTLYLSMLLNAMVYMPSTGKRCFGDRGKASWEAPGRTAPSDL